MMTVTEKDEVQAIVLNYLRRMGYRQTERLFKEEAHIPGGLETIAFELRNEQDSSISNYLLFSGTNSALDLSIYETSYEGLRNWIYDSLDAFKDELIPILYPIYVHCILDMTSKGRLNDSKAFMEKYRGDHSEKHEDEIERLSSISDASQLKENPLANAFRSNKYNLIMSAYSFQLLMNFLQDSASSSASRTSNESIGSILILKIINQFINIRVLVNKPPSSNNTSSPISGLTGVTAESGSTMNRAKISWGVNAIDPAIDAALQQRSKSEGRLNEIIQGTLAQLKRIYTQSSLNAPNSTDSIPKPIPTAAETNAEIDKLRQLAKKANLSSTNLPSICFYTLHNSFEGITCIEISPISTLMATGNRDSFIDLWSLNHEPLRSIKPSTELAAMDLSDFDSLEPMRELEGSLTKRLIGHYGPVYSCKFFYPDGQRFMISVSQDSTARLWSLDTFSCVVVYRGHNSAIWDVDVAPLGCGPYFVTASADKTARLWATEHIQPLRIFSGHLSDVDVVKFHPNGNYIITGSSDKTCRMWEIQNGNCVRLMTGHSRGVSCLAISPDGRFLVSGDRAGQIRLWDLPNGNLIKILNPKNFLPPTNNYKGKSTTLTFSTPLTMDFDRDGKILAVGGSDQIIRLWDVSKLLIGGVNDDVSMNALLASYPTKQTPIFKVHFTYRNVLLASGPFLPED